ncbi:MAG: hypothetical protein LBR75_06730 [Prevotellaceae bacterium]|nr:hypothetical protein [Prevotellaceae bacterium]
MDILTMMLPSLVVLAVVVLLLNHFMKNENERREFEHRKQIVKTLLPNKLRAYERLVVFLERTAPDSLVLRVQQPSMTAIQLQAALLQTIRTEYEHNVSQQLYVSKEAWQMIINAKENVVKLINTCAMSLEQSGQETSGLLLAQVIIQQYHAENEQYSQTALDFMRAEVRRLV